MEMSSTTYADRERHLQEFSIGCPIIWQIIFMISAQQTFMFGK